MEWLNFIALTLFQPHKRLQPPFLAFLIAPDPLRLENHGHMGASAHGRLLQHNRGGLIWKRAPHALDKDWKLELHNCRGSIYYTTAAPPLKQQVGAAFTFKHSVYHTYPKLCPGQGLHAILLLIHDVCLPVELTQSKISEDSCFHCRNANSKNSK